MFPSCYCVSDCIVVIVGDDTAVTTGNSCHSVILEHERKRNGTCAAGSFSLSILISTRFAEMERQRAQSRSFFLCLVSNPLFEWVIPFVPIRHNRTRRGPSWQQLRGSSSGITAGICGTFQLRARAISLRISCLSCNRDSLLLLLLLVLRCCCSAAVDLRTLFTDHPRFLQSMHNSSAACRHLRLLMPQSLFCCSFSNLRERSFPFLIKRRRRK